jgi:peptidoglycan/LPS O-acetylase OafA/YrhL
MLGHFKDMLHLPDIVAAVVGGGHNVALFFALSGFILTYRYWDAFAGGVHAAPLRSFYVARVARIYPSYVLALLVLTGLYVLENRLWPGTIVYPANTFTSWLANLFALQTFARTVATQQYWNAPAWSISTEFCFYFVFPFLVAWVVRRCRSRASLLGLLLATTLFAIAMQAWALYMVYGQGWSREIWVDLVATRNIFWRIQQFMVGVVGARLLYGGHLAALSRPEVRNRVLALSLAVVLAVNLAPWPEDERAAVIMRQYRLEVFYMFPVTGIIVALAAGRTFLSGFLERPLMVLLGHASYGLYIFHWIPWVALTHASQRGWAVQPFGVTVVILLTILASIACYISYERPVRQWIRRRLAP